MGWWITLLLPLLLLLDVADSQTRFFGGSVRDEVNLNLDGSPYLIERDVTIERSGRLTIQPGVELHFAPQTGITVNGVLSAKGTSTQPITLTLRQTAAVPSSSRMQASPVVEWPDVRLVDGNQPSEGRLQIRANGHWHSVCTNSKNWSLSDVQVLCRDLGYESGSWYQWFVNNNDSRQLMLESPMCDGREKGIELCRLWKNKAIGSGVCDYHMDIGIKCNNILYEKGKFWRGIHFFEAQSEDEYILALASRMRNRVSKSVLEHVMIFLAGEDKDGRVRPAISSLGVPPRMKSVFIKWSAFTGIEMLYPPGGVTVEKVNIEENRGYGIFVNTSWGSVKMENITVLRNGADGVFYSHHHDVGGGEEFCTFTSSGTSQLFPVRLSHSQNRFTTSRRQCCQEFTLPYGMNADAQLTAHFTYLMSEAFWGDERKRTLSSDGFIEVFGGFNNQPIAKFFVQNTTTPQSVTSIQGVLKICYTPAVLKRVLFSVVVVADIGRSYDLNITRGVIHANNGCGIRVESPVSGVVVNHTVITNSSYTAGLHVKYGSGDVVVNNSYIGENYGDGVNISLATGYHHVDRSKIVRNTGRGIAIWINESNQELPTNHTAHVSYSLISENGGIGLLMGNTCRSDSNWNVSMNTFSLNEGHSVVFLSCWEKEFFFVTNLMIAHNKFFGNKNLAIHISPAFHLRQAVIEHNSFRMHPKGVIYVNNYDAVQDDYNYEDAEAKIMIRENFFQQNTGLFVVNIGLNDGSPKQELLFAKNILSDNEINEAFYKLNPRSRVAAVVVVSSSNCKVIRNNLINPDSRYEIGAHLEAHSKIINASYNFYGELSVNVKTKAIYERIFDRKNRYNLAQIEFLQYRTQESDLDTNELLSQDKERDKFMSFQRGSILGGEIRGVVSLQPGIYNVKDDLFVTAGSRLTLQEGTILKFDHSVGMMVQGLLDIRASDSTIVLMDSGLVSPVPQKSSSSFNFISFERNKTITVPSTAIEDTAGNISIASISRSRRTVNGAPSIPVRLSNVTEGRLEVFVDGKWGSVCSYGFTILDAGIVCQQLGYVLNRKDWILENSQFASSKNMDFVSLSKVECTRFDTDILSCKSQRRGVDFENSCHSEVGMRCYPPSWSGVRMGVVAEATELHNLDIQKAGLLDYSTYSFKSALQIDMNKHKVSNVKIQGNSDTGIEIIWNQVFRNLEDLKVTRSQIASNGEHGLTLRSPGVTISNSVFISNRKSAIHYDPMTSHAELKDLMSWIAPKESKYLCVVSSSRAANTFYLDGSSQDHWFLFVEKEAKRGSSFQFMLETYAGYSIGVMVLNPPTSSYYTDELVLHTNSSYPRWDLRKNSTAFPLFTGAYRLFGSYSAGSNPRGNIIFYIAVQRINLASTRGLEEYLAKESMKLKTTKIEGNLIKSNGRGYSANNYNSDSNEPGDYFRRHDNETVVLTENKFNSNLGEVMLVRTADYISSNFPLSEINYTLLHNTLQNNRDGIIQHSHEIINSNNLFHWHISSCVLVQNEHGGIALRLPYVWQYNENFTHSVVVQNNSFAHNKQFELSLGGHFSRFNFSQNVLEENQCKSGLIGVSGMEKLMLMENNIMKENSGQYMVQFNIESHADKFGLVEANFRRNTIVNNRDASDRKMSSKYKPLSFTVSLRGVQYVNITRNLLNNPSLQFEFIAGVLTGSLDNSINVGENWWGTHNVSRIKQRIFDFDDWNNYAVANFSPFLGEESLFSAAISANAEENIIDLERPLGGRMRSSMTLKRRSEPYRVITDLTIMPEVTLTIEAGAILEFYPSVGMLVLGDLIASGFNNLPVIMRVARTIDEKARFKRKNFVDKAWQVNDIGEIRLCYTESCHEWNVDRKHDGFLEFFNKTTLQWVPVCDAQFTESNAQVVCNELGFSKFNVHFKHGPRVDMSIASVSRVRHWPLSLQCTGTESSVSECPTRPQVEANYSSGCHLQSEHFVYVFCGKESKLPEEEYWGGIRFAISSFEHSSIGNFQTPAHESIATSKLLAVNIFNAGILHGKKSAAVQVVQRNVNLEYVTVSHSAHHALEVIAPYGHLMFHRLNLKNNSGAGVNFLLLGGASTENPHLPYTPLKLSTLPYNVFSLVEICDTNKKLVVRERVLLYYKYSNRPVDCVKIFTSAHQFKRIGFRMLQFNLFNSTTLTRKPDSVRIYDGDIFNQTAKIIADLGVTDQHKLDSQHTQFHYSNYGSLSVQLHASSASSSYGFIAEIVTLPPSYNPDRGMYNNITFSEISHNSLGALIYQSAGETSPIVSINHNIFEENCETLFGNFTSCESAVYLELQNTPLLDFHNNLLRKNTGGLKLSANAHSSAAALHGVLTNNLFVQNEKQEALRVQSEGPERGSYQQLSITQNYFTRNISPYKDNVQLAQIVANFANNVIVRNYGRHQLGVFGFDRVPYSYQTVKKNWLYCNAAADREVKSSIVAGDAGQIYAMNYLVNVDNDFELSAGNQSFLTNTVLKINATNNWWGFEDLGAVSSRIHDSSDAEGLINVMFDPFLPDNSSVLSGICSGGWQKIEETCYLYVGARMSLEKAKKFCESENSTMPFVRGTEEALTAFLASVQINFNRRVHRSWVRSFSYDSDECTVLFDGIITRHRCDDHLPFFCEKDPEIRLVPYWYKEPLGIAALTVSTVTALLTMCCLGCWLFKSRERYKEKLQRRNSIRASIRSNRSFVSSASLNEVAYKRQIEQALSLARQQQQKAAATSLQASNGTLKSNEGSFESFEKNPSQFHMNSSADGETYSVSKAEDYGEIEDRFANDPKLENANINLMVKPTFDLTYENRGFKETTSASGASNVDYSEARDWSPANTLSTVDTKGITDEASSLSPYDVYRPDHSRRFNSLANRSSPSECQDYSSQAPLSTFTSQPQREQPNLYTFRSQSSLIGADSDATGLAPSERKYLETSLDGDSFVDTNYDYYDFNSGRLSPTSTITVSTNKSRPPLETAM